MQIKVTYNKTTGEITLEKDTKLIEIEVNSNAIEDTDESLSFEIAVNTSTYESVNSIDGDLIIE